MYRKGATDHVGSEHHLQLYQYFRISMQLHVHARFLEIERHGNNGKCKNQFIKVMRSGGLKRLHFAQIGGVIIKSIRIYKAPRLLFAKKIGRVPIIDFSFLQDVRLDVRVAVDPGNEESRQLPLMVSIRQQHTNTHIKLPYAFDETTDNKT